MKLEWTQDDSIRAGEMGWSLRPWRYVMEDGCWTIRCAEGSQLGSDDDAVNLVIRLGSCRDVCESERVWNTCNKAAQLAMGSGA